MLFRQSIRYVSRVSASDVEKRLFPVAASLERALGSDSVSAARAVREQHGRDESHHPEALPDLVVKAASVEAVSAALRICNQARVPVVPFGSGSGLEGGVTAVSGGVCVDVGGLEGLWVHEEDFDVTVAAGVLRKALNYHLRDKGLWFPLGRPHSL